MNKKKWFNTFKFLAAYLVAAWTFLQFVDWTLNRYSISPYWVDVLLWIFIGIIPSLLIYFFHRERINNRILKLREKIIFPLNIFIVAVGLYFGFGSTDLGATTKEINYTDDQGSAQKAIITKEEFRIGIPIYGFKNDTKIDSLDWMRYGIGQLLVEDLKQNKSISPDFAFYTDTSTKIEESSLFNDFYIDGTYKKEDDIYTIKAYKRKATNGKILKEKVVSGDNFLALIDELTVFIIENSGFVETKTLRYLDYPINEFMSNSLNAVSEYIEGNYSKAIELDNQFALAYLEFAKRRLRFSQGKLEVQDLTDKAFEYRQRLPLQKQLEVNIQRNLAYENFEDAEEQVQLQLEVDPHNAFYNDVLFSIYGETRETEKFFGSSERLFDIDPKPETGTNLAVAAMVSGHDDMLINEIKKYELISPNLKIFRIQPLLFKGEIEEVKELLEDVKTLYPSYNNKRHVYDSAVAYIKENGYDISKFKHFEGRYRSGFNEQVFTFWIDNNRLIKHVKNQAMDALLPAGPNTVVNGFLNNVTYKYNLALNDNGKVIGIKSTVFNYKESSSFWYWKEDETIQKAHEAFDKKDFASAEELYKTAIEENPKHDYLKNYLKHIQYLKERDIDSLVQQHQKYVGTYGPREFWIENNAFFYKRKSETTELPKYELLPIDDNRYMDISRAGTIMAFEINDKGQLASASYSFNTETFKWELTAVGENYFLKD
ncbi:hypothetical protein RM697_08900 [Ichthyenterobacterium sp. W332]|uniref:Uncharacterized protein n=1 Tax=Microcosmobacter mediterraneus TaxID=3075607 RepID=A0ABU2YM41_9FLAO|nr:hypothetical protein [Ichthyenterobacterium sp. W332]MDT0558764.1 hypothetical protein [Ichthyenterobacterium sp. W332]